MTFALRSLLPHQHFMAYAQRSHVMALATSRSCDQCTSGSGLVLESRRDLLLGLVVSRETVDAGFNENQAELRVFVFSVYFEVLSHRDGLFNKMPEVFGDGGSETCGFIEGLVVFLGLEFVWRFVPGWVIEGPEVIDAGRESRGGRKDQKGIAHSP
jgi:hypothetical protein